MAMACLNLPPSLRYRAENMHLVGVIPGPKEPSLDEINHYLSPLVDDLLTSYTEGTWYTRTPRFPRGRRSRSAVVPLVCDLPGARKVSGTASYSSHNFCSLCDLKKVDINNLDMSTWKRRLYEDHLKAAKEWRDAPNKTQRKTLFKKTGIRWTELLRLPYWDPTQFVVVDAMHNLFLGLVHFHFRTVLGMTLPGALEDESEEVVEVATAEEMVKARKSWTDPTVAKLRGLRLRVLRELCHENGIAQPKPKAGSQVRKQDYIVALLSVGSMNFYQFLI